MKPKYLLVGALLLLVLALAACSSPPPPTVASTTAPQPVQQVCPTSAPAPECPAPPEPVVKEVPFESEWAGSPHADAQAEAFNHWNEDDPKEIPTSCAKCHSTPGYQDFVGADGSAAGTVDKAAPIGTVITCVACHNAATASMTSVVFPSGAEITNLGPEARCMVCHQGRASTVQVNEALDKAGLTDSPDTVSADLSFVNIHYFAAAATLYGTKTKGGFEYPGKTYDSKNDHVAGFDTCIGCHNQHTLELRIDSCKNCHQNVTSKDDLKNIRMNGSLVDYDGDGNTEEGIAAELEGLQGMLYQAIQAYAKDVAGTAIVYDINSNPYYFIDTNGNGTADPDEINSDNRYNAWTGRLLEAAYNYQTSIKDPGAFAHGGKYIIELLYDSIEDLNTKLSSPVDLSKAHRVDAGHFAGSEEPFRHWDEEESGMVPATCAKCHTRSGLPFLLANGVSIAQPPSNGLNCATCHNDLTTFTRFEVGVVTFPSGAQLDTGSSDSNLCINCHQGRESKVSLDQAIAASGLTDDEVATEDKALAFRNPHYFATAATLFGTDAKGAYEYANQQYDGRNKHVEAFDTCVECHDVHALTVKAEACGNCHAGVKTMEDLDTIRNPSGDSTDYDGDGNVTEGIAGEVDTMGEKLYAALQAYATGKIQTGILYDGSSYPYFFTDTNGNGTADEGEVTSDNAFKAWTPRLLRAAYNLQWVNKDPGAFAHNGMYIMQVLYDSIKDVGGDVTGMTRPAVVAQP